ncbi:hypothetical protein J2T19_002664 [Paenibacillus tundrae]|uniref:Transposase n=1 Tax=Paenibacillus tundrae TaxID=528187 RepID=A0ABT9WDX9_9BACL|nr:hypothetical protein [Paenibacillus tundrae]
MHYRVDGINFLFIMDETRFHLPHNRKIYIYLIYR